MKQRITNFENFINEAAINIRISKTIIEKIKKEYPDAIKFIEKNNIDVNSHGIFIDDGNGTIPDLKYFYNSNDIKKLSQKTSKRTFDDLAVQIYGIQPDIRKDFGMMFWDHCFAEISGDIYTGIIISEYSIDNEAYEIVDKGNFVDIV